MALSDNIRRSEFIGIFWKAEIMTQPKLEEPISPEPRTSVLWRKKNFFNDWIYKQSLFSS